MRTADEAWAHETPERVLNQIDRFHPIPDAPDVESFLGRMALLQRPVW